MEIQENYDVFKAHLFIFGNKQHLFKLFGYKAKEFTDAKTTAIGSTVSKLKVDKDKHNITVSDELQTSTKRQRKAPEGKPAGA